jgi:hypothetical protein
MQEDLAKTESNEEIQETVEDNTPFLKPKKERTPAQKLATEKMLTKKKENKEKRDEEKEIERIRLLAQEEKLKDKLVKKAVKMKSKKDQRIKQIMDLISDNEISDNDDVPLVSKAPVIKKRLEKEKKPPNREEPVDVPVVIPVALEKKNLFTF